MPRRTSPRAVVRQLHLWLALSLGLLVVLLGLTGSLLVYRPALDRWFNADIRTGEPAARTVALDKVIRTVRTDGPDGRLRFIRLPEGPATAYEAWVATPQGVRRVYVAPDGRDILGVRAPLDGVLGVVDAFHTKLFFGGPLAHALGLAALAGLLAVISGIVLWWPRGRRQWRSALRVRTGGHWLKTAYDLHRVAGAVAAPLLLLSFVTGLSLVYHETSKALLVDTLGGPAREPMPRTLDAPVKAVRSQQALLERARAAMPDATATWVVPASRRRPMVVRFRADGASHPNGNSYVAVHPGNGTVIRRHRSPVASAGQQAANLRYPLHIGTALGALGRPLTAGLGVVPAVLFVTGVLFWWRRRGARCRKPSGRRR